jgi:hypothetical protein
LLDIHDPKRFPFYNTLIRKYKGIMQAVSLKDFSQDGLWLRRGEYSEKRE